MTFVPATELSLAGLTDVWNRAYEGYFLPMTVSEADVARHLRRGGIDLARSLVALGDGRPVALSLAAFRGREAWIGGFGVAREMRRKGLATRLAQAQCAVFDAAGVTRARLEVIDINPARAVYEAAGFEVVRTLVSFDVRREGAGELETLDAAAVQRLHPALHQRAPTWRRELASVLEVLRAGDAEALGLPDGRGYALATATGGLLDAAAEDASAAAALFAALCGHWPQVRLVDEPEDTPIAEMLKGAETAPFITQYEMVRT